jgi:hypothetical protein
MFSKARTRFLRNRRFTPETSESIDPCCVEAVAFLKFSDRIPDDCVYEMTAVGFRVTDFPIMKYNLRFKFKVAIVLAAFIFFGVAFLTTERRSSSVGASSTGPSPAFTGAPGEDTCIACHTGGADNEGPGVIFVTGIPKNYRPGQQFQITVTTEQEDAVTFGFQMTAIDSEGKQAGEFIVPTEESAETQIRPGTVGGKPRSYVSHNINGTIPTEFGTKSWSFTWTAPSTRIGKVGFYAAGNAANSDGSSSGDYIYTTEKATLSGTATANFDGDDASDISVFRPSNGVWYSLSSEDNGFSAFQFGAEGDIPVPGDYDGDGITDYAVFRPSTGAWYILGSTDGLMGFQFGAEGDIPVVGDYDGDLIADIAVWRPSNGVWYIRRSSDGAYDFRQFGISTDKIAQGDYDGDAKTDIAVYRPSNGTWYIWKSSDNGFSFVNFGLSSDKPVQGDYDGDGKTDIAVYRPSDGTWYVLGSRTGFSAIRFGISTDVPVPGDYDADGRTDVAVYRNGTWFILRSSDSSVTAESFGLGTDVPIATGYLSE